MHGVLDYVMGLSLVAVPAMFSVEDKYKAAQIIPMALGGSTIVMSLLTDYELSISRQVPMRIHLNADLMNGILLAASPWLFKFSKKTFMAHLVAGLMEIAAAVMTKRTSNEKNAVLGDFIQEKIVRKVQRKSPARKKAAVAH